MSRKGHFKFQLRASIPSDPNIKVDVYLIPESMARIGNLEEFRKLSILKVENGKLSTNLFDDRGQHHYQYSKKFKKGKFESPNPGELRNFNNYELELSNDKLIWLINGKMYYNRSAHDYFNELFLRTNEYSDFDFKLFILVEYSKQYFNYPGFYNSHESKDCPTFLIDHFRYHQGKTNPTDIKLHEINDRSWFCNHILQNFISGKSSIKQNLTLLWEDDFNGTELNKTNWMIMGSVDKCERKFLIFLI